MKGRLNTPFIPLPALLAVLAIVTSCGRLSNNSTAMLWTDSPELAAYVELYNAETDARKIEVVYKEIPWLALESSAEQPELVAGTRLDSSLSIDNFASLEKLINKGEIDQSRFYPGLFEMGQVDGKCFLIPVSFSLPVVVFMAELNSDLSDDYIITIEEMRAKSEAFNVIDETPTRIGYSPRWEREFVYRLSQLFGTRFSETKDNLLVWNEAKVQESLSYAIDWIESTNGGYEREDFFESKYMYDPMYKLLDANRVLFNSMMIDEVLSVPTEVREHLDFRWLSDGERIFAGEDVLFIGAPKQSRYKKSAEKFISWLFAYETQVKLLETAQFERMRSFGIANGFSSLTAINTDVIPQYFPFVLGHIPHSGYLEFPDRLPESWRQMREEVILPWFAEAVSPSHEESSLAESLAQWRLRQPDLYR
jgi:ABC-type glycerol-3-phosphate transport system substrate-binding protein